jgi:hypothetical protein
MNIPFRFSGEINMKYVVGIIAVLSFFIGIYNLRVSSQHTEIICNKIQTDVEQTTVMLMSVNGKNIDTGDLKRFTGFFREYAEKAFKCKVKPVRFMLAAPI